MSKKDFLKNTMDLVGIMIENDQDLKELSKSDKKKEWKKNLQSLLKVLNVLFTFRIIMLQFEIKDLLIQVE